MIATFNPDADAQAVGYMVSNSTGFAITVNVPTASSTKVNLTASSNTVQTATLGGNTLAQPLTLTVAVTAPANGVAAASGTITILDGTLPINTTPLMLNANGTATLQVTSLPVAGGNALVAGQSLTAVFTPDATAMANGYVQSTSPPIVVTVGTPAELVLNQLFNDLLGRSVNPGDLQYWIPQLGDQSNPASQQLKPLCRTSHGKLCRAKRS